MPRQRVGDVDLYYQTAGAPGAPWVVLVAGFSAPLEMWAPQIPALVTDHRVLAYDMRGHGRSDVPFGGYDAGTQSEDLLGLMDSLGVQRACVVGDAAGGVIAVELALRHPLRVSSLVLVGTRIHGWDPPPGALPPPSTEEESYAAESRRLAREGSLPEVLEHWWRGEWSAPMRRDPVRRRAAQFRDLIMAYPGGAWRAVLPARPVPPHHPRLGEISVPVLVVSGGDDMPIIKAHAEEWCRRLRNRSAVVVAEAGHVPSWEFPSQFNESLLEFLRDAGRVPGGAP
jgi:3-oxoadipate enol-lactonase